MSGLAGASRGRQLLQGLWRRRLAGGRVDVIGSGAVIDPHLIARSLLSVEERACPDMALAETAEQG